MVAREGSASFGSSRGCWSLFSSTGRAYGGARVCPDSRIPDLYPSNCTHERVSSNDIFTEKEYKSKTLYLDGTNFILMLPPAYLLRSNNEVYTIDFRYDFKCSFEIVSKVDSVDFVVR